MSNQIRNVITQNCLENLRRLFTTAALPKYIGLFGKIIIEAPDACPDMFPAVFGKWEAQRNFVPKQLGCLQCISISCLCNVRPCYRTAINLMLKIGILVRLNKEQASNHLTEIQSNCLMLVLY